MPIRRSAFPEDRACETNPIFRRSGTLSFHYSIIPAFQSDADCAKQSQLPAVADGPGFEGRRPWDSSVGTRPDGLRPFRAGRAKQSQFPLDGPRWTRAVGAVAGPIMQNKANSGRGSGDGKCCIEKELWIIRPSHRSRRNKANSGGRGKGERILVGCATLDRGGQALRRAACGHPCQARRTNKANLPRHEHQSRRGERACAKQSQSAQDGQEWAGANKIASTSAVGPSVRNKANSGACSARRTGSGTDNRARRGNLPTDGHQTKPVWVLLLRQGESAIVR